MSLSDADLLELNVLCSALVDGILEGRQRERLGELLASSEDARRYYARALALSASLHDYAGELQLEEAPARRLLTPASWTWQRWTLCSMAAAAAVLLAFWWPARHDSTVERLARLEDEPLVATLSAMTNCAWTGAGPSMGDELRHGQRLQLVSGLAEITFHSGAQVVLEGPATLELSSAWQADLRHGTLRANVPPEAIGFRVVNSDVVVVDLGTEFSMVAAEQGGTEVFVLKGAVQAGSPGEAQPVTLHERQARRFARAGVSEIRDREQKMKRWSGKAKLAQFTRPASYLHWSFDDANGPSLHATGTGRFADGVEAQVVLPVGATLPVTEGYRRQALALDGHAFATAEFPQSAKRAGTSVAFWVHLSPMAELDESAPMLALRESNDRFDGTSISWNRNPAQGSLGALRVELEDAPLIGSTSLRDGRWHHVAVVLGASGKAREYVDGRLEAATPKRQKRKAKERGPKKEENSSPAMLVIGHSFPLDSQSQEGFHGLIDELFVADRALSAAEVRQLFRENQPAAPANIAVSDTNAMP